MGAGGDVAGRAGPLVGEGREARIFAWDASRVVRVPRVDGHDLQIEREAAAMTAAAGRGIPVPAVEGTTVVDGRLGLVMARLDGPDLLTLIARRPWTIPSAARALGATQARLHDTIAPGNLAALRAVARHRIERAPHLSPRLRDVTLTILDGLPDGDRLLHGDLHPGNVLVGPRGPAIIDWANATRGDPMGDVARTRVLLGLGEVPATAPFAVRRLAAVGRTSFTRLYTRGYRGVRAVDATLVDRWQPVCAACRLYEGIEGEAPALLELLERHLVSGR